MKGKYKKFLIVCGKALMLLCLAAFALVCVFYYASPKDEAQTIRTKAEEVAANARASSGIDLSKYPTANLMSYPYADGMSKTMNGVTFNANNDGSITANGTATGSAATFYIAFSAYNPNFVPGKTYYLSGTSNDLLVVLTYQDSSGVVYVVADRSFVWEEGYIFQNIYVHVYANRTVNNVTIYPMLNVGETAYPYSPPYDLIYNDGYESGESAGHEAGYQEGHEAGYQEGYEAGKKDGYEEGFAAGYNDGYGKAVDILATGLLTKGNSSYINKQLAPGGSGVSCNAYSDYFTYSYAASYSGLLYLNCARSYSNGYKLKIKVESVTVETVFSAMLLDLETSSSAMYEVFRLPVVSSATTYEKVVNLPVSTTRSFKSFVITPASAPSGGTIKGLEIEVVGSEKDYYDNGYDNGYTEGKKFGYDSGYTKGYAMGKSDAMSQMSDSDLPSSVRSFVFSLFDAPVTSFLSAFNLTNDGFDLGSLVAFIFTAIVIVGVIRLVT